MILKLTSALGLIVMVAVAWLISENRRRFPWRTVLWGIALQFAVALLVLGTRAGLAFFNGCQRAVDRFISFANEGNQLVFGPLAQGELLGRAFGPENTFIFIITVTGTIILVAAASSLLYHYGALQRVVRTMASVMRRTMGASGSESLAAAANIFMGQTEAPLVVRPYLARMTRSELNCLMTGGFATIAGGVLAVYSGVLKVPAGHLITASVMSAPAALLIAKVLLPETEKSETSSGTTASIPRETVNGIDAICVGASDGMKMAINVAAMLIALVALVAAFNWLLSQLVGPLGWRTEKPLQQFLGWINAPFAWLIGVPVRDCGAVGEILGERIVLNEFIGYLSLTARKAALDERSYVLATYALCGFANFGSVAVQIGGLGALVPERRADLVRLGGKAMIGGILACYMTACVAGIVL
ncbi:MAG TPA: nucleoside transporter C-terminal domain-containing protein [Verrucomicrobiae bacterium]|nr:nucleoside transporter C-terminal domain-containing protein [Verrucomicrobiae bacterium]